ncbi:helix-turn-helix transcriptional regulator [Patescibacteria group bacterium]|nr:helix-turn-helix transcriptional regulator [Nanoarchaeota archaeon]MBU1682801.1 helix-turn-helix transcriptional regulator [Patescibacteria group bacterium]
MATHIEKDPRGTPADIFCPIGYTIDIISKKWSLYIIRELAEGSKYYNQILKALNWGLTPKILSERLKELVKEKIISKKVHNTIPVRVEYSLTARGKEFINAFKPIEKWSKKWNVIE